jgi:hypothetical protein
MIRFSRIHLSFLLFICSTCLTAGFSVEEQLTQIRENYVRKEKIIFLIESNYLTSDFVKGGTEK